MHIIEEKNKLIDEVCASKGYTRQGSYTNAFTKILVICDKGHTFKMLPRGLIQGNRCSVCSGRCPAHMTMLFERLASSLGFQIIQTYKTSNVKVRLMCPDSHTFDILPSDFKRSKKCPACSGKSKSNAKDNFLKTLNKLQWVLLESYLNSKHPHKVICDKGHHIKVRPNDIANGVRCGSCKCTGYRSSAEGFFYVVLWENPSRSFLKYGVTNVGFKRITQQEARQGNHKFKPKIIIFEKFNDGSIPLSIEKSVRDAKLMSSITKEHFKDGWSETLDINDINLATLSKILDTYGISFNFSQR